MYRFRQPVILYYTSKVNVLKCPSQRFEAYTYTQDLFSLMQQCTLGKQSAGIWGMKCVKKCHFSLVNKGVLKLRELLKKREESSLPSSTMYSIGRLTFDLSVIEEDPLNSICCNSIPNLPTHFHLIKTPSSYLKVLDIKHSSRCTFMHSVSQ